MLFINSFKNRLKVKNDILKIAEQKEQYFTELVKTYQERLYWHIRKIVISHDDAHDVLQNTFLKAWKGIDKFRGDAQISTWLYSIATNESINLLNQLKRKSIQLVNDMEDLLLQRLESDNYIDGDELQIKLQKAILKLPEKQRIVFNMRYFDEMSYQQISEILGTSVGALKASYHHASKKIEALINE